MPITPLPNPPSRSDPTNFSERADAFMGALPTFATETNSTAVDVNGDAVAAAASAVDAAVSATAANASANVSKWVSGTTYAQGDVEWSPINFFSYRRKVAGAGTTDPSADPTNWALVSGAGDVSLTGVQTLTNKTLTSPTINTPTINTPTINTPTINTPTINTPTINSINGGQLAGMRNVLINGGMQVGQRGSTIFSATNNLYGWVDRWLISISGTTVSALGYQDTPSATNTNYALQVGNVTTTGATMVVVSQRIEALNSFRLNGNTITMSGKVKQVTGTTQTMTFGFNKATAGVNNWSTQASVADTTLSVPNDTWTSFTFTTTLGASDATNGISFRAAFNSLGAQSNTQFFFGDCQLELGPVATPFEHRPYGMELALCQRYYYRVSSHPLGFSISSSDLYCPTLKLPSTMRIPPTGQGGAIYDASGGSVGIVGIINTSGAATTVDAVSFNNASANWTANVRIGVTIGLIAEL